MSLLSRGWNETISIWFYLVLMGALLSLVFFSLQVRHEMIRLGYDIEALKRESVVLSRIHKELMVEMESLNAIERIDRIASEQLQMLPASPSQRVYVQGVPISHRVAE